MIKNFVLLLGLLGLTAALRAQTAVNAGADQNICVPNCANLTATITPALGTNTYTVAQIPYAPDPFTNGTALVWQSNSDDEVHGPYAIGFNFCFFGVTRNQFYIGTNGWVGFSNGPTAYTAASVPNTAATVPKDCIMGPWQDWYPAPSGGTIRYQVYGTAPFRRLVVSWNNCALYNCTFLTGTFQITLYETTNIVETHIQAKPGPCAWAGGTAVHGIHNFFGTIAYTVPGRNSSQWTAFNDAWRFSPADPPAYTFQWLQGVTPISNNLSVTVCPTVTTTYTAQITYSCDNTSWTDQVTVTVGSLSPTVSGPVTICQSQSTGLSASGGVSYVWSPSSSLNNSTLANPTASPTTTTTYTVVVTDANGCTGSATVLVTVLPPPNANAGPGGNICPGGSANLNASGGTSYTWTPAASLNNSTIANPVASPTVTTTYTVTVSNGSCSSTATVTVTVFTPPSPTASANTNPICSGSTTQLSGTGGASYSWTPASSLNNSTISNPLASPTVTTTYTLTVTDANGCTGTTTVTVTVNTANATASATNNTICPGGNTSLNATGGGTYVWTPAASLNNSTIANPTATPTTTTTYTVTVTAPNGCTATATTTINVVPPPNLSATASPPAFCLGGNSQLNASGGVGYSWTPTSSLSNSTIANPVATPTTTTSYTVTITDANGCSGTVVVTVTVNQALATATATPAAICSGSSTTLNVAGNGTSFAWTPSSSLSSSTVVSPSANPTTTTTYTVLVTDANGCTATSTIMVTVNALPNATASATNNSICLGSNTTLTGGGGTSYAWTPSGSLSASTGANPTATPTATTTYTVTVTNTNGCTATATVTINVNPAYTLAAGASTDQTCGNTDGTATAGTPNGGSAPFTYLWNNGQTGATATGLTNGTYTVVITDANGCTASQTVTVNQIIGANANASAVPPSGISPLPVNFNNTSSGATNYIWNFGDGSPLSNAQNPSHTYNSPGTYTVMLIVYNNNPACADTIYLTVEVVQEISVIIPNVFTPNNDNSNDILTATIQGLKSATVEIYNRWGNLIDTWDPITAGWDGKAPNGQLLSDGCYYYVLNGTGMDDLPFTKTGWFMIMK
ncbi:MAG: gliding motility-associated C-terminal domain-containing protein [Bacteroidia bacterium]|nr:gliding motility-associated C-terminal domain-containing protein [Bacteroidia bacterium]